MLTNLFSWISKLWRRRRFPPAWQPKDDAEYFEWLCSAAVVLMRAGILYNGDLQKLLDRSQPTAEEAARLAELLGPVHAWLYERQDDELIRSMMLCSPENLRAAQHVIAKEFNKFYVNGIQT